MRREPTEYRYRWATAVPAVVLALLPRLVCPCQLTAYAGVLTSLGLSFLLNHRLQLSLTTAALTLAVGLMAVGARRRRGYLPFAIGCVAAIIICVGKFMLAWPSLVSAGVALLIAAVFWNAWPPRRTKLAFDAEGDVMVKRA